MLSSITETRFLEKESPLLSKIETHFANHASLMLSTKLETLLIMKVSPLCNHKGDTYFSNRVSYRGQSEKRRV
jgi:hypothetical protein